jgi:hypothetical protein
MAVDVTTSGSSVRAGSPRMLFLQQNAGGGLHGFAVDPSGRRFLLVVPAEKPLSNHRGPELAVAVLEEISSSDCGRIL